MEYVDIRVHLKRAGEDFNNEFFEWYEITEIEPITDHANEVLLESLAERLAQTDYGQIDIAQALLAAVGGGKWTA